MYVAMRNIPALNGVTYKQGDPVPVSAASERIIKSLVGRGILKATSGSAGDPIVQTVPAEITVDVPTQEGGTVQIVITGDAAQSILNQLALQGFLTAQDGRLSFGYQLRIPIVLKMSDDQPQEFVLTGDQTQLVFALLQTQIKEMGEAVSKVDDLTVLAVADAVDIRKSAKPMYADQAKKLLPRPPDGEGGGA